MGNGIENGSTTKIAMDGLFVTRILKDGENAAFFVFMTWSMIPRPTRLTRIITRRMPVFPTLLGIWGIIKVMRVKRVMSKITLRCAHGAPTFFDIMRENSFLFYYVNKCSLISMKEVRPFFKRGKGVC